MKKIIFMIFALILIASFAITVISTDFFTNQNEKISDMLDISSRDETIVVTVGNEKIYQWQIDQIVKSSKISIENAKAQFSEKQLKEMGIFLSAKSEDKALEELIEKQVLLNEAERQNLIIDEENARKIAQQNFENVKKENGESYAVIKKYIQNNSLTEEKYIEQLTSVYVKNAKIAKVKEIYETSFAGTQEEKEIALNRYIDSLISSENIEYISK